MLCIISSAGENLSLVNPCQQYNKDYEIIVDTLAWPYDDKDHDYILQRIQKIIQRHEHILGHGNCKYIVSPSIELGLLINHPKWSQTYIFPLFSSYIQHCFSHSPSGRLGYIGGWSDLQYIEKYIREISKNYKPSNHQYKTKRFLFPFASRTKETSLWNYFLRLLSPRQIVINKIIKQDLTYLKDANVDTIIPLQYSYFRFQRTITSFFNNKKQKFHKWDILSKQFSQLGEKYQISEKKEKAIIIHHTGSLHLIEDKKREHMLSGGGKYDIQYTLLGDIDI